MRRFLLLVTALLCGLPPVPAYALGAFGFRAGAGLGVTLSSVEGPESGPTLPWALGAAWHLDLSLVGFEADLLYRQGSSYVASRGVEVTHQQLALPMLLKFGVPGVPFLDVGLGIEPRLLLTADTSTGAASTLEDWVFYAPIALGGSFDVGGFELGAELRLEMQLSNHYLGPQADDAREHDLMLYLGGFF